MPVNTLHKLDKIVFANGVEIDVLERATWDSGIDTLLQRPSGHPVPMFSATRRQRPVVTFDTPEIDKIIDVCPVNGLPLTGANYTFFKRAAETGSAARSAAQHQRIAVQKLFLHWSSIKLQHNGIGSISCVITAVHDGTNDPIVHAGSVALPGDLSAGTFFGIGPVFYNGSEIEAPQEATINSGVRLQEIGAGSEVYDSFVGVDELSPRAMVRTLDMLNWSQLTLTGTALNGSQGLVIYGRKYKNTEDRVPVGTSEHIKIQGLHGQILPGKTSGSGNDLLTDEIDAHFIGDDDDDVGLLLTANTPIT